MARDSSTRRWLGATARVVRSASLRLARDCGELLFPRRCLACDGDAAPSDAAADADARSSDTPRLAGLCPACSAAWPWRVVARDAPSPLEVGASRFDRVVVALRYAPPASELILRLKYGGLDAAALPLAASLAQALREELRVSAAGATAASQGFPELLVPIPMHPLKRWLRGGDHAELLVEELGLALGLPVVMALRRRRATAAQGGARSLRERIAQVRGAFVARGRRLRGAHVGLVDDVVTSGATASAAAKALRLAGARAVTLLAVAGNG
jgi:predicted amidophosphoribosyltransferase